jgi:hypothetical protein
MLAMTSYPTVEEVMGDIFQGYYTLASIYSAEIPTCG